MDTTHLIDKTGAGSVIHSSTVAEERFVNLSHTDPLAAFCFAVGVLSIVLIAASIGSARLKSRFKWLGTMGGKFALILVGAFFLLLPIAIHLPGSHGDLWPGLAQAVPATFYFTVNITGVAGELEEWTPVIHQVMGDGLLSLLYYQVLCFYTVAAPVMLALTAVDFFANGFTGLLLYVESAKKSVLGRDIYVFYDLNDNTVTLAKDLLDHVQKGGRRSRSMPLLVFCDLSSAAVADGNGMAQQVREEAYGCATVVFTPLGLESVPGHLARWTQTRCNVYYLVVSDDTDDNVRATIALCDTLTSQMVSWEMGARAWDVDRVGARPSLTDRTRRYAGNIHVWCVHGNPDDDLIFDSLPHRRPDEEVLARLFRRNRGHGSKEERRRRIVEGLSPLMVRVRDLVEVRLLSEERQVVWDSLVSHPLTEVLDPVDVSAGLVPRQRLVVLVLGVGSFGAEAVRAAFWFGRLPGVELRIVGVDLEAGKRLGELAAMWPGLMAERVPEGEPSCLADLAEPLAEDGAEGKALPTVCLVQADARTEDLSPLLAGKEVEALCWGPDGAGTCTVSIGRESRVYTVTCLGDDEVDLDVSLRLHRTLSERVLAGTLDEATPPQCNPLVSVLVRSEEVLESVRNISGGEERFGLVPFGSTEDVFSYDSILAAPWEDASVNLQAAYDGAQAAAAGRPTEVGRGRAMEDYNAYEVRKLSNRAATRFTFYRLWCLGLGDGAQRDVSGELQGRWLAKLGVAPVLERLAAGDACAVAALAGVRPGPAGTGAEERAARRRALAAGDARLRSEHPLLCAMGDLEHARWCAFLRANGWRALEGGFDGLERTMAFVGRSPRPGKPHPHESMRLMRHYYLVDDPATYRDHGADCADDPAACDRMVVAECLRILSHGYVAPKVGLPRGGAPADGGAERERPAAPGGREDGGPGKAGSGGGNATGAQS
ncbi:hypothetical protein ATOP_14010 [Granulimonas faecalis]|uniref:RyR domain-containing protein n=1 Tax=Granulimonas faecalis TaxID=2894155 RepID=A0AAV5B2I4_9ACTN|nr:hypothetical protein [Granulimonas faecalis]GJM55746.1 hypothetical protein ATOP_14010 [Granulimonas faecalis]